MKALYSVCFVSLTLNIEEKNKFSFFFKCLQGSDDMSGYLHILGRTNFHISYIEEEGVACLLLQLHVWLLLIFSHILWL